MKARILSSLILSFCILAIIGPLHIGAHGHMGGCLISQDECVTNKDLIGSFVLDIQEENECLSMAQYYADMCQNVYTITSARFLPTGHNILSKGCAITLKTCKNDPSRQGQFRDTSKETMRSKKACFARAQAIYEECGNTLESVVATYLRTGESFQSTACVITLPECLAHPELSGRIIDTHPDSRSDEKACHALADHYSQYCENYKVRAVATFLRTGQSKFSNTGCQITQEVCMEGDPMYSGTFMDAYEKAAKSEEECLDRARQFHKHCKNPEDIPTTAKYLPTGKSHTIGKAPAHNEEDWEDIEEEEEDEF